MATENLGTGKRRGRPSGTKESKWVKHLAEAHTEDAIATLAEIMNSTNSEDRDRIAAATALLDRAHGKPRQEITDADGAPLLSGVADGLLEQFRKMALGTTEPEAIDVTPKLALVEGETNDGDV